MIAALAALGGTIPAIILALKSRTKADQLGAAVDHTNTRVNATNDRVTELENGK